VIMGSGRQDNQFPMITMPRAAGWALIMAVRHLERPGSCDHGPGGGVGVLL